MRSVPVLTAEVNSGPRFEIQTNPITLYVTDRTGLSHPRIALSDFINYDTQKISLEAYHTRLETHFKDAIMIINTP